jgi:hypothetical protein
VFTGRRHPGGDALVRYYMAERGFDALDSRDEPLVRHVAGCAPCAARFAALCNSLDSTATAVVDQADAAFPADRLREQRERIMRRLDSSGGRVIPFPATDKTARPASAHPWFAGWIAAAAAAGLLVGLAAGRMLQLPGNEPDMALRGPAVTGGAAPPSVAGQIRPASLTHGTLDDLFMSEVDSALANPRTPELEAIDAMTWRSERLPPRR